MDEAGHIRARSRPHETLNRRLDLRQPGLTKQGTQSVKTFQQIALDALICRIEDVASPWRSRAILHDRTERDDL